MVQKDGMQGRYNLGKDLGAGSMVKWYTTKDDQKVTSRMVFDYLSTPEGM